jgi:hypothetical protein
MHAQASDVTAAILIWLPGGARLRSEDFCRSAGVFASFAEAVERALGDCPRHSGGLPWIEVGSRVFNPEQVRSATGTAIDVRGRNPMTA